MPAAQSDVDSPSATRVYAKTDKGRAEVAQRSAGLTARQRQILIMADGHKPAAALNALMPSAQVDAILVELAGLALIAPVVEYVAAPVDATRLAPAKAMMIATATDYLGPLATELMRQIEAATDEAQLLRALGHWHMAMQASKFGKDVAQTHLETIKASLHQSGVLAREGVVYTDQ